MKRKKSLHILVVENHQDTLDAIKMFLEGQGHTVVAAPDGHLWVSTSNTDGRGDPASEDDRILLIEP